MSMRRRSNNFDIINNLLILRMNVETLEGNVKAENIYYNINKLKYRVLYL